MDDARKKTLWNGSEFLDNGSSEFSPTRSGAGKFLPRANFLRQMGCSDPNYLGVTG